MQSCDQMKREYYLFLWQNQPIYPLQQRLRHPPADLFYPQLFQLLLEILKRILDIPNYIWLGHLRRCRLEYAA